MSDIEQIIYPSLLNNLHGDLSPVKCIIWKGDNTFDTVIFNKIYPFDTIDDIKRMICNYYKNDYAFIPKFTFVGITTNEDTIPSMDSTYIPLDVLWFPKSSTTSGKINPKSAFVLKNPRKVLKEPDLRFVTSDGSFSSPIMESRGRSNIEDVFSNITSDKILILHVYPLKYLLKEYTGPTPISEEDWNKRFAPFYPYININGPYEPIDDDIEFANKIYFFVKQREYTLNKLNFFLEEGIELPTVKVNGIKYLRLKWDTPVDGFEGCGYMFYRIPVTNKRPYIRLIPSEGTAVTKLHVKGVLPIPTLDDPRVLEVWGKEMSPTPESDYCYLKYIHRESIGISQTIYGTIRIFNNGDQHLVLQPPKQIRKLDPILDFRNFSSIIDNVFEGLPQKPDDFKIDEISILFLLKMNIKSKKFNKSRIQQRLPLFQTFFTEIKPLPNETPVISLRYKAISQYASENNIFSFLTQYSTNKMLEGESPETEVINILQNEFKISKKDALNYFAEWYNKRGAYTLQNPDENDFTETYNPGIDIHVYSQHPSYYFHVNRIDSYNSYIRIFTLLSLLFVEDDDYFSIINSSIEELTIVSSQLEEETIQREEGINSSEITAANESLKNNIEANSGSINSVPDWMINDPFADSGNAIDEGEVIPETAPNAIKASTVPQNTIENNISSIQYPKEPLNKGENIRENIGEKDTDINTQKDKETIVRTKSQKTDEEQRLVNPQSWFIKKLQEIDPRLFIFKSSNPKQGYSRQCQGNDDKQPSVLTKDQYERMREIYEDDPIFWLVYPLEGKDEPIQPLGTEETVTIMRYGSDSDNINYYFCPEYYCLSDEIMLREKDFKSSRDRDGNPKSPNTCPFCYGKLITNKKDSILGHTVIKRKEKKGSTYHGYVDFMGKSSHPEGFALPCCYLKDHTLRMSDPQFSHLRTFLQNTRLNNEDSDDDDDTQEEQDYKDLVFRGEEAIEYAVLFEMLHKKYIIESNKQPDPGVFAIAPPQYDIFFKQKSGDNIITRIAIHLKLRPNAIGFLRVGTENTIYESLFGVIAPLLYRNSINEVKERILEVVTPRIFLNSHFGNLVLEFYNPSDTLSMPTTRQELMSWSSTHLGINITSTNMYQAIRIYNSYKRFIKFIKDPTKRKDLRHIQPLLAEPGLFTSNGIQLIIMEDNGDNSIIIKCPIFGVSLDRNKKNDFAFISRSMKSIGSTNNKYANYELYIHTSNKPAKGAEGEVHETIIRWDYASRRVWPEIVKTRIDEYINNCQSKYRSIYTSQEGINSMAMIPLSKAVDASPFRPEGIVKDSYNHIVGLTFRSKPGASTLVALPIVDDGVISISSAFSIKSIYLDWENFKPAPVDEVISYYKLNLEPLFALYPGYIIKYIVRNKLDRRIVAVQLENGIYIPASPPKDESVLSKLGIDIIIIEQFEWSIDKEIAGITKKVDMENSWDNIIDNTKSDKGCGFNSELIRKSTYVEFEELYQQFRLMVSNWLTSQTAGAELRKGIENIIFNDDLPEYEKRKRLYIYISSVLLSWFYPDDNKWDIPVSFLRKDCRIIDNEKGCSGTCYWKKITNDSGKCLLHVISTTSLSDREGERDVSTAELFTKRVIDELVRFPNRRRQLMRRGEISKISTIIEPIRQDDQYIIPESSPIWTNLLRLDWAREYPEEPKYYEEMSRQITDQNTDQNNVSDVKELPKELISILGNDTKLILNTPDVIDINKPLLPFIGILGVTFAQLGLSEESTIFKKENLVKYVSSTNKPIGIIDLVSTNKSDTTNNILDNNILDNNIYFIRPFKGVFNEVTIIVFLSKTIGLLTESEGDITIKISALPEIIQDIWKKASIVQIKKRPQISEDTQLPIIIGQNPVTVKRKRPIVATIPKETLVKSNTQPNTVRNKTRRKPRIATS